MTNSIETMIVSGIVIFISLLLIWINLKKVHRCRQILLPIIMVLYSFIVICNYIFLGDRIEAAFQVDFQTGNQMLLLLNMGVLLNVVIVKIIACLILRRIRKKRPDQLLEISQKFYEYDDQSSTWFLKEKWENFRRITGIFTAIMTALTIVTLCGILRMEETMTALWVFPVILLVGFLELYNYLNSFTKKEYYHSIVGDDAAAQKVSNFYKIRGIYETLFPESLLTSQTSCDYVNRQGVEDYLKILSGSKDPELQLVSEFFELHKSEHIYDVDSLKATAGLIKRENCVFLNPFYRDLGRYLILPLVNELLNKQNVLVIIGRNSNKADVCAWLREILTNYSKISTLWEVSELSEKNETMEVGVLSFHQLYDMSLLEKKRIFLENVGFVLLLEPSLLSDAGQIGLSILDDMMHRQGQAPVYCIADRVVEGLVDTMSHVLHAEITTVVAAQVPRFINTSMSWAADGNYKRAQLFSKQTRYLGNGMELAAVAVKNQIPKVQWISETKSPIRDLKWIVGQQYSSLCKYMNLPVQQKAIYEKIRFVSNIWGLDQADEQFLIVEDEFDNMFAAMRLYLSRGEKQIFVNVLSENYLLRDYMRCNQQLFISNINAVPSVMPDYAKTERNVILKLILLMFSRTVSEQEVLKELDLIGYVTDDAYAALSSLLRKYTYADEAILSVRAFSLDSEDAEMHHEFRIDHGAFEKYFSDSLASAYYIVEDEMRDREYLDARLYGQVTQLVLPGQFLTYGGKYYQVKSISPESGVILRRASDLYDSRKYYRQIRDYVITMPDQEAARISEKTIMDMEIAWLNVDFTVHTSGYLELTDNGDLRSARHIALGDMLEREGYLRSYRNKRILRIKLPDTNDKIRFTICLLLSEMFRSIYAASWQYLAVTAVRPDDIEGMLNTVVYEIHGDIEEDYIYILEDSDMDLGLLESVEKNLMRYMELLADFVDWHFEKMREPAMKDPVMGEVELPEELSRKKARRGLLARIRKIFSRRRKDEQEQTPKPEPVPKAGSTEPEKPEQEDVPVEAETDYTLEEELEKMEENVAEDAAMEEAVTDETVTETSATEETEKEDATTDDAVEETSVDENVEEAEKAPTEADDENTFVMPGGYEDVFSSNRNDDPDMVDVDGTDIFDETGTQNDNAELEDFFDEIGLTAIQNTRYQKECYLKYGYSNVDDRLRLKELVQYLNARGWCDNALTKARKKDPFKDTLIDLEAVNTCDFCGLPMTGVSYEVLSDGRIRCNDCSASAINTEDQFRELFYQVLQLMESYYGIEFRVPVSVQMADANVVNRGFGRVFTPSTGFASRVLGYAQRKNGSYRLLIENGSPRLAALDTMVHEMTHIWQYINWDDKAIEQHYGNGELRDMIYEGMAMWTSIQFLYLIGETAYAYRQEVETEKRKDIYGIGFCCYRQKYPLIKDMSMVRFSPFTTFPPL